MFVFHTRTKERLDCHISECLTQKLIAGIIFGEKKVHFFSKIKPLMYYSVIILNKLNGR